MKKIITGLLLSIITITGLHAQQSIVTTGGDASGSGGSVSYSIGQVADTTNQGVQQPYEFATVGVNKNNSISLHCLVYPNPSAADVILKNDLPELNNLRYELYDMAGKLLLTGKIITTQTILPLKNLSSAIYMLKVVDNTTTCETFKIIKN